MQLGMIGLGRMGANMVRRLLVGGHDCAVFDVSPKAVEELVREGAVGAPSLADFVKKTEWAACHLVNGASGHCGQNHRGASAVA